MRSISSRVNIQTTGTFTKILRPPTFKFMQRPAPPAGALRFGAPRSRRRSQQHCTIVPVTEPLAPGPSDSEYNILHGGVVH